MSESGRLLVCYLTRQILPESVKTPFVSICLGFNLRLTRLYGLQRHQWARSIATVCCVTSESGVLLWFAASPVSPVCCYGVQRHQWVRSVAMVCSVTSESGVLLWLAASPVSPVCWYGLQRHQESGMLLWSAASPVSPICCYGVQRHQWVRSTVMVSHFFFQICLQLVSVAFQVSTDVPFVRRHLEVQ